MKIGYKVFTRRSASFRKDIKPTIYKRSRKKNGAVVFFSGRQRLQRCGIGLTEVSRGHSFVRYADDCSIYVNSLGAGERVQQSISKWLKEKLKLKVNASKSGIRSVNALTLLGFSFVGSSKGIQLRISSQSYQHLRAKVRLVNTASLGIPRGKAYQWGNTWRGCWRTAHSPVLNRSLTTGKLQAMGHYSLTVEYARIH